MSDPYIAILMLGLFILIVRLGFPIAFTLIAMGLGFGYYAYATPDQVEHILVNPIFNLFVQNTFSVMSNDVLVAVPLFLFMGYVVERANIVERLFYTIQLAARHVPGSMAVAALITCAVFATATGIIGAVVTLMGLLALPAMLKVGYDTTKSSPPALSAPAARWASSSPPASCSLSTRPLPRSRRSGCMQPRFFRAFCWPACTWST